MHNDKRQVSLFERLAVVTIFLLVIVFAIQNVWHEVKASEGRTMNNATTEYKALKKKMYPEQFQTLPQSLARMKASSAVIPQNTPIN
jgi:hypothetical protein